MYLKSTNLYIIMKQITIQVPDWITEEDIKYLIETSLFDILLLRRIEELVEKLGLTEKDLEEFEKIREEVWKEIKKEYEKEGLL